MRLNASVRRMVCQRLRTIGRWCRAFAAQAATWWAAVQATFARQDSASPALDPLGRRSGPWTPPTPYCMSPSISSHGPRPAGRKWSATASKIACASSGTGVLAAAWHAWSNPHSLRTVQPDTGVVCSLLWSGNTQRTTKSSQEPVPCPTKPQPNPKPTTWTPKLRCSGMASLPPSCTTTDWRSTGDPAGTIAAKRYRIPGCDAQPGQHHHPAPLPPRRTGPVALRPSAR